MPARIDNALVFSSAQPITATAPSTNTIDLYDIMHRLGQSARKLYVTVECVATFNNLTSLGVTLQDSADNATFSATELTGTFTLASGALAAGILIMRAPLPTTGIAGTPYPYGYPGPGPTAIRRYIGLEYSVTGTAPTTGEVTSFLEVG